MASRSFVLPVARWSVVFEARAVKPLSVETGYLTRTARIRFNYGRTAKVFPISQRSFSTTVTRKQADVNDSSNPFQQDRESDRVDVCIVGGGI